MVIVRSSMVNAEVLENKQLTERLYSLRIQIDNPQTFIAGQFVRLQLPVADELIAKSYSLVNAPDESVFEVFFNVVPDGKLSNALAALKAGDGIEVSQPANGFFTLAEAPEARDLWMVATGTGLGPYLSILRTQAIWSAYETIVLVHGVPLAEELVYQDVIQPVQQQYPERFRYIGCVSRQDYPPGIRGRVTEALTSGELEKQAGLTITAENSAVMLCGNHNMIDDMKALLGEREMRKHLRHKPGHILTEQYF